jgi:hypothetical protein
MSVFGAISPLVLQQRRTALHPNRPVQKLRLKQHWPTSADQGLAGCVSPLHESPMPQPHPFAAAPAPKGRARAVPKPTKPRVAVYGYARVSTGGQSVDAQSRQLRAAGAGKVFREVASGAKTDRAQLARLVSELAAGDVVMVTRLDRLARSTRELLNMLAAITEKKAGSARSATHALTPPRRTAG